MTKVSKRPEVLLTPTQLARKLESKKIEAFKAIINNQRIQISHLDNKINELSERLTSDKDREQFERQIRDLRRELDRRDKMIAELRSAPNSIKPKTGFKAK